MSIHIFGHIYCYKTIQISIYILDQQANFFNQKFVLPKYFFGPKYFQPKFFLTKEFSTNIYFRPNFFSLNPIVSLGQSLFGSFFLSTFFLTPFFFRTWDLGLRLLLANWMWPSSLRFLSNIS